MVRDGYYYAIGMLALAVALAALLSPWWAVPPVAVAGFCLWFFRDPERIVPATPGAIVSPADGRVTDISTVEVEGAPRTRVSIFLNVFDVHVNRSPIAGTITAVEYRKGRFRNAMAAESAGCNEQNIVTVSDGRQTLVFKQIAGLIARRIVFTRKVGDCVARGERVGMIKFGSRTDLIFDPAAAVQVRLGDRVTGGATVIAFRAPEQPGDAEELAAAHRPGDRA
jgi:phosphatidylserine decarboxylase